MKFGLFHNPVMKGHFTPTCVVSESSRRQLRNLRNNTLPPTIILLPSNVHFSLAPPNLNIFNYYCCPINLSLKPPLKIRFKIPICWDHSR